MADDKGRPLYTPEAPTKSAHGGKGAEDLGVRRCVACGRPHGPTGEWLACLSAEVLRLRRELADRPKAGA